jgi:CDP-2,3-bis-(O-geranylgeranyl)-sn-glycerol synthase
MNYLLIGQVLLLLITANGAPILARRLLRHRFYKPLDGGLNLADGQPLLGPSKTWRGLIAALMLTAVMAWMLGLSLAFGALFGLLTMAGDLVTSFIKRRVGMQASSMAPGFDYLLESCLPVAVLAKPLGLAVLDIVVIVVLFMLLALILSRVLFWLGVRKRPY